MDESQRTHLRLFQLDRQRRQLGLQRRPRVARPRLSTSPSTAPSSPAESSPGRANPNLDLRRRRRSPAVSARLPAAQSTFSSAVEETRDTGTRRRRPKRSTSPSTPPSRVPRRSKQAEEAVEAEVRAQKDQAVAACPGGAPRDAGGLAAAVRSDGGSVRRCRPQLLSRANRVGVADHRTLVVVGRAHAEQRASCSCEVRLGFCSLCPSA